MFHLVERLQTVKVTREVGRVLLKLPYHWVHVTCFICDDVPRCCCRCLTHYNRSSLCSLVSALALGPNEGRKQLKNNQATFCARGWGMNVYNFGLLCFELSSSSLSCHLFFFRHPLPPSYFWRHRHWSPDHFSTSI